MVEINSECRNNGPVLPEILSPAGSFEKLTAALRFGADAVYLAGKNFGMRSACDNFDGEQLRQAVSLVHSGGKKIYLAVNTLPHAGEYPALREFLSDVSHLGIDGFIAADLGVISLIRETVPEAAVHISTQASICSPAAAAAYASLGARRLVLARELTLGEIREIRDSLPPEIELECFVHGSMCVSYSGRCMLSNMLAGRDANRGECAQPCRWNYTLIEEKRPDERIPVEETPLGTFIMSSKDMCMLEHVGELYAAGVGSFKIEGRVKSAYYTAVVTNAYSIAVRELGRAIRSGIRAEEFRPSPELLNELMCVSHREYCTGFYFGSPAENPNLVTKPGYVRDKAFLAVADDTAGVPQNLIPENVDGKLYRFIQKNKISAGEGAQILSPGLTGRSFTANELWSEDGLPIAAAPHPGMAFYTRVPFAVSPGDIMRAE